MPHIRRVTTWLGGLVGALGLGALVGFVVSLLRRRPSTSYTASLRQPVAAEDEQAHADEGS